MNTSLGITLRSGVMLFLQQTMLIWLQSERVNNVSNLTLVMLLIVVRTGTVSKNLELCLCCLTILYISKTTSPLFLPYISWQMYPKGNHANSGKASFFFKHLAEQWKSAMATCGNADTSYLDTDIIFVLTLLWFSHWPITPVGAPVFIYLSLSFLF